MAPPETSTSPTIGTLTYRPWLDGLRGIAVTAVVVYHLNPAWLPGGYLGVDVFFTMSGFLITSLLLLDWEKQARIRLSRFWTRRARRLLPASLTAVLITAVWLSSRDLLTQAVRRGDLFAALGQVQNWRLIRVGESYFEQYTVPSPLRHFWSLAIEEQFYLLWPLVVAFLIRYGRRILVTVTAGIAIASVLRMGLLYDAADPSRAYFGTDSRVHQILVGCLLALWVRTNFEAYRARRTPRLGMLLAAGGLLVWGFGMAFVGDASPVYYLGGSAVAALAAAALILGGELGADGITRLLAWRPLVALGKVSYGLYIWHWIIIVWIAPGTWGLNNDLALALVRVTIALSITIVSYFLVEQPIREGRVRLLHSGRRVAVAAVAGVAVVAAATAALTWRAERPAWSNAVAGAPELQAIGSGEYRVALLGDSVAFSLMPGLSSEAERRGWTMINAARPGCPLTGALQVADDGAPLGNGPCDQDVPALRGEVVVERVDAVIWHDLQSTMGIRGDDSAVLMAGSDEWASATLAAWSSALAEIRTSGAQVFVLIPPWRPTARPPGECGDDSYAMRCREIEVQDERIRLLTERFIEMAAGDDGVHRLALDDVLCPRDRPCPDVIDGIEPRLLGRDRTHFTPSGSAWIAPRIADEIDANISPK